MFKTIFQFLFDSTWGLIGGKAIPMLRQITPNPSTWNQDPIFIALALREIHLKDGGFLSVQSIQTTKQLTR